MKCNVCIHEKVCINAIGYRNGTETEVEAAHCEYFEMKKRNASCERCLYYFAGCIPNNRKEYCSNFTEKT